MNSGAGPTAGDRIRLTFDLPTDRPTGAYWEFFTFDPPLAPDTGYSWLDATTYQLTVGGSGGGTVGDVPHADGGAPRCGRNCNR